jgi:type IV pilus assembly protein PilM
MVFMAVMSNNPSLVTYSLGIDIGRFTIKSVLLEQTPHGISVRHVARVPTVHGSSNKGVIVAQKEVAAQIRKIIRQIDVPIRSASLAVPTEHVVVRWIDLPRMDAQSLQAASRFEASRYLPYSTDDAEIVMIPAGQTTGADDTPRMRALLAASPRKVVRSRAEVLEMAGLDVNRIEIEPLACMRAFGEANSSSSTLWRGQPLVHVHLGEESSSMCVVQDGQLRFVHTISWGSLRLTQALANSLNLSVDQVLKIKSSEGAFLDNDGVFSWGDQDGGFTTEVLVPEILRLRREVQRLLNYYRSLFPERSYEGILDRLTLSGGTANLRGLTDLFSSAFQAGVSVLNPFQSFASHLPTASFAAVAGHSASFVISTGLALTDFSYIAATYQSPGDRPLEAVWRRKVA